MAPPRNNRLQGRIQMISIEGFRSLKEIHQLELPQLTVLIGANGAGKSTLIRFFEMLSWMLNSQNLQEFILRHGGGDDQFFMGARQTPRIRAEVRLETEAGFNDYRFELAHLSAGDNVMVMNEAYRYSDKKFPSLANWTTLAEVGREAALRTQDNPTAKTICALLRRCKTYQFHDTSINSDIRKRWDVSEYFHVRSDGGNLAAVLLDLHRNDFNRYQLIVRQIQRVLPSFGDFVLEEIAGKVELRWRSKYSDKFFGAHLTSDGSLRLFCLLTLLNLSPDRLPDVLFFDEPELGLHPHAITLVAEMLKRVAKSHQVFIATQSPYLVDCFALENIIIAKNKDGATSFEKLSTEQYQQWLDDDYLISDIWLKEGIGAGS
ncbi:MAG: AAA family ATPase [Burkholderiales bacterium]|nr:AAA family ATPase [Burkholderiales bacterium]